MLLLISYNYCIPLYKYIYIITILYTIYTVHTPLPARVASAAAPRRSLLPRKLFGSVAGAPLELSRWHGSIAVKNQPRLRSHISYISTVNICKKKKHHLRHIFCFWIFALDQIWKHKFGPPVSPEFSSQVWGFWQVAGGWRWTVPVLFVVEIWWLDLVIWVAPTASGGCFGTETNLNIPNRSNQPLNHIKPSGLSTCHH